MVVSIYDQLSTSASHFRPQSDFTDPFSRESQIVSKLSRCRRRLMFTPRIFHGESIYLDLRTANGSRQRTNLETDLVAFGGQVEAFLSKEITHVITDRNDIGGSTVSSSPIVSKGGRDGLSRTPKALPAALSRAQALLQRSVSKQQQQQRTAAAATDPVSLAKQWGIRVTPLNKVLHIIEREKAKCDPNIKLSNSKQSGQATVRIRKLEGAFLKVEDTMGKYRPFFKNFSSFPVVDLMDPAISHNQSPFHPRRKAAAAVKRPDVGSNKDMFEKKGSNLSVVSKEQHVNKDTPIPKVTIKKPPKSGFCEICDAHYTNLIEHTQSDSHQMFASGSENFRSLDEIISNLPSLDQLQTSFFSMTLSDTVPSGEISSSLQDADEVKDILPEGNPNVNNVSLTEPRIGQKTPEQEALHLKFQQANTGAMNDDTMSHTDVAIPSLPRPIQSILQGTESGVKAAKDSSHHGIDNYSSQEHGSHPPTCPKGSEHLCSREDSNQTIIGNQSSPKQSNIPLSGQKEQDSVICEPINGTLPDAVFKSSQRQSYNSPLHQEEPDHLISACEEITHVLSQQESNIPQDSNLHCSISNNAQPDIVSETSQKESNISSSSPQKMLQAHIQNDIMQHSSKSPSCVQLGSDIGTIPTMVSSYALKILNSSVEDARELPDIVVENNTEEIGVLSAKPDICQSKDIADNANIIEQSDVPQPSDLDGNGKCDMEAVEENLCQTPDEHLVINNGSPIRNDEAPDTQNSEILPQAPSEGINESIEEPDSEATIIGSVSECDENRLVKNVASQISPRLVAELQNTQHVATLQKTPLKDFTTPVKSISDNVRILSESSVQAVLKELNFLNTNFITSSYVQVDNTVPEDGQKDASQDVPMECEFSDGGSEDVAPTLECQLNNTDPSRDLESGSYPSMPELEAEVGFILPEMQFLDAHSNNASMPEPMSSRGSFFDVSPVKLISQFPFSCFDDPEATNAYSAGEANTTAVSSKVFTDNQNTSSYQFNSRLSVAIPDDKHVPTSFSNILSTLNTENSGVVNAEQQVVDYGNMESIISRIVVQPAPEDLDTTFIDTPRVCSATQSTLEDMPSDAIGSHLEKTNQQIAGTELNLSQDINMEFSDITSSDPMENAIAQNLLARLQNGSSDSESGSECDSALDLPLHADIGVHQQLTCSEATAQVPNGLVNVEQVLCDALDACDNNNATTVNGLQDKVSSSFDMSCFVNPSISIASNNCTTVHATQEMVLNSSDGSCPEEPHTIIPPNNTLNAQERVLISSDSSWFVNPPNTNISRQSTTLVVPPEKVSNSSGISFCVNPSQNAASNITILTPQERVLIASDISSSVQSHTNVASYSATVHAPQEGVSNIPDTFCSVNLSTNAASVFEYCHREQRNMGTVPGTNISQELTKHTPVSCHDATKLLVQMQPHVTKQQCSAPVPVLGRSKCFQTIGLSTPTSRFHENLGNFSTLSTSSEDVSEVDSNPEPAGEDEEPEVDDAGRWSPSMILNPVSLWWKTDSVSVSKDVVSSEVVEKTTVIQESLTKVPTATKVVVTKVHTKYKKVKHAKERNSTSHNSTSNLATDYCDVLDNAVSPSAERSLKDKVKVSKSHKHNKAKPLFPDSEVDDSNHIDKSKYKSKVSKSHRRNKSKPLFRDCDASIGNVDTHLEEVNKRHMSKSHRERKSKSSREAEFDVDVESFTQETKERKHQRKSSKSHKHKRSRPEMRNGDFSPLQPHETSMSQRNVKACTSDKISKARSKHSKEDAKTPRAKQQLPQTATPQRVASLMRHHDDTMPTHSWTVSPSHGLKLKICKVVTPVRDSDIVKSHPTVHGHSELSELEAREHTSEKHRRKDRKLEKGARRRKLAL